MGRMPVSEGRSVRPPPDEMVGRDSVLLLSSAVEVAFALLTAEETASVDEAASESVDDLSSS